MKPENENASTSSASAAPTNWFMRNKALSIVLGTMCLLAIAATVYVTQFRDKQSVADAHGAGIQHYTCPMHPQIIRDKPGKCPICGMELVPVRNNSSVDTTASAMTMDTSVPNVKITPQGRITANVATVTAAYRIISNTMEVPASVDFNEATHRVVSARYSGRIERLFVRETGQFVRKGDPLMDIYSPELVTAEKDYLLAREARGLHAPPMSSGDDSDKRMSDQTDRLVAASRKRLELLGMSDVQIAALEKRGEITYSARIFVPVSGVVIRRSVTDGAYVTEGAPLLELADLSSVWVLADVNESDAYAIRTGMAMSVFGPALGGERLDGHIEYIYPTVDAATRTVRMRGLFGNARGLLKPGMYLTATIRVQSKDVLAVPVEAVVRTGKHDIVYVEVSPNTFEPRQVQLGIKDGDYYQIVGGNVNAGDKVVSSGGFLMDSESKLSGAVDQHAGMNMDPIGAKK